MKINALLIVVGCVLASTLLAQAPAIPGDVLPGTTPREFEEFRLGLEDFREIEEASEGLGPLFNGTGCASCHNVPVIGGGSPMTEMRAGARDASGEFRVVGGTTLYQLFSIPDHRCQSQVPVDATVVARRMSIPLFGAGLIEAIADETLLALEDPFDRDRDGISGRAAMITDVASGHQRVGRFGWKAQVATLLTFSGDAYTNEMGITNDLFPHEPYGGISEARMRECDRVSDPEDIRDPRTGKRAIDNFEAFMKFLAPLSRGPITDEARTGEQVFNAVGCSSCHTPSLTTGASASPALSRKTVPLFSDLLLHDIGTGDGIAQEAAQPGQAHAQVGQPGLDIDHLGVHVLGVGRRGAVRQHAGEATAVMERLRRASDEMRRALFVFLDSL